MIEYKKEELLITTEERIKSLKKIREQLNFDLEHYNNIKNKYVENLNNKRKEKSDLNDRELSLRLLYIKLIVIDFIKKGKTKDKSNTIKTEIDKMNYLGQTYTIQIERLVRNITGIDLRIDDIYNNIRIIEGYLDTLKVIESPLFNTVLSEYASNKEEEIEQYILKRTLV